MSEAVVYMHRAAAFLIPYRQGGGEIHMQETEKRQILRNSQIETLEKLLQDMKYGSITLIVQDGKVIQIDKTEKYRM